MALSKIRVLTKAQQDDLLKNVKKSKKYTLIVLMMLDAGMRASEVARFKIGWVDLKQNIMSCQSLKKGKKKDGEPVVSFREIPMTERLREAFEVYFMSLKKKGKEEFLFPTHSETGHIHRNRIWRYIKRATYGMFSPHDLRHTFATRVVNEKGNDIRMAQALLGHKSQLTTEVYLHVQRDEKREAITSIERFSRFERLKRKIQGNKKKRAIISHFHDFDVQAHVGRSDELGMIESCRERRQNLLITGRQGVGKTHLLKTVKGENILWCDDMRMVKKTIGNMIKAIEEKKPEVTTLVMDDRPTETVITRESTPRLIEILKALCNRFEYTIIFDDLTDITKTGVRAIEQLKDHFHIIAAARQIKVAYQTMITNFETLELKALSRYDSHVLIDQLSRGFHERIADFQVFRDHIFDQSRGIPLFIYELVERFSREQIVTIDEIRQIRHTGARKDIDMSFSIVLALSSLMILRYVGSEVGDSGAYRLFGGVFLLFALFARPLLNISKRKYV